MARKKPDASGAVRARVLTDCQLGKANDVVELPAEAVEQMAAFGLIDTDADAVAYAESLA
jgi:hypothetical protein